MLVVLDTNHFRELQENSVIGQRLAQRIEEAGADVFTCIVVFEELVQGWLALLRRQPPGQDQVVVYRRLQRDVTALTKLVILPFDDGAADVFARLRKSRPRAGTMDLKIASICIAHDATLLTRNLADFRPLQDFGLRVENWLD
jgi:tRNA(fMet)-specific endonuclease VapC